MCGTSQFQRLLSTTRCGRLSGRPPLRPPSREGSQLHTHRALLGYSAGQQRPFQRIYFPKGPQLRQLDPRYRLQLTSLCQGSYNLQATLLRQLDQSGSREAEYTLGRLCKYSLVSLWSSNGSVGDLTVSKTLVHHLLWAPVSSATVASSIEGGV